MEKLAEKGRHLLAFITTTVDDNVRSYGQDMTTAYKWHCIYGTNLSNTHGVVDISSIEAAQ